MGYSEVLCNICGVSFNIARIRTPQEKRKDAWASWGPSTIQAESFVDDLPAHEYCPRDGGCMFTFRKAVDENRDYIFDAKGRRVLATKPAEVENEIEQDFIGESDDEEDQTWAPDDDSEDEPLEYVSDDEVAGHDNADEQEQADVVMTDVDETGLAPLDRKSLRQFWSKAIPSYNEKEFPLSGSLPAWYKGRPPYCPTNSDSPLKDELFPLYLPAADDASVYGSEASFECDYPKDSEEWIEAKADHRFCGKLGFKVRRYKDYGVVEHIAGPGCTNTKGYSGHEIGAAEMRGCYTVQGLVRKPKGVRFDPLPDDEDFERNGEFFLSGLADHMASRDWHRPTVTPARHGYGELDAENCIWIDADEDDICKWAIPFHPACFEIYKRASLLRYSRVDVTAFTSWWSLDSEHRAFDSFPRDPDVKKCQDQSWYHKRGTAWTVANPLFVPQLGDIFETSIDQSPDFSSQQRAFRVLSLGTGAHDPFRQLPAELQFEVLDHLDSKDIASLRLSSRVFSDLSVSYFQKLLMREMPWLWEAWPTGAKPADPLPYSPWATMNAQDAKLKEGRHTHELAKLNDYVDIVTESQPELAPQLKENFARAVEELMETEKQEAEAEKGKCKPFYLPPNKTNYFTLYTLITRHWSALRGLQNRRRIWKDCQEIIKRIDDYKAGGLLDDDGLVGDVCTARQRAKEWRAEKRAK